MRVLKNGFWPNPQITFSIFVKFIVQMFLSTGNTILLRDINYVDGAAYRESFTFYTSIVTLSIINNIVLWTTKFRPTKYRKFHVKTLPYHVISYQSCKSTLDYCIHAKFIYFVFKLNKGP